MASAQASPVDEVSQDVNSIESKFCYDLMKYVLDAYKLSEVFYEVFTYDRLCTEKESSETKETKKHRNRAKRLNNKAFCTHIGDAVMAISHVYRFSYKLRFDFIFPHLKCGLYTLRHCMYSFVEELFKNKNNKIAIANAFLAMCSLFMEIVVYMAFRGKFYAGFLVWGFFEQIFVECFKQEFEECGGWMLLKQVARPWWKSFEISKRFMEINKPEFIYYKQDLDPDIKINEIVIHGIYEDQEDSSDFKYDPPKVRKDKVNTIALGINGCYHYCLQKPKFDDNLLVHNDEFTKKLLKKLAILEENNLAACHALAVASGFASASAPSAAAASAPSTAAASAPAAASAASAAAASAASAAAASAPSTAAASAASAASAPSTTLRTVPVPKLILHPPIYTVPEGYLPRHHLTSGYRKAHERPITSDVVSKAINALSIDL